MWCSLPPPLEKVKEKTVRTLKSIEEFSGEPAAAGPSALESEKCVLRQEFFRRQWVELQLGPVVQVAYKGGVAALQFELDITKPDFYKSESESGDKKKTNIGMK